MKVLIIGPYPLSNSIIRGGVEAVMYNLIEGFKYFSNVEVTVISCGKLEDKIVKIADNVIVKYFKSRYSSVKMDMILFGRKIVYQEFTENKPDIIHIQGNGSNFLLLNKVYNDRVVVTQHAVLSQEKKLSKSLRRKFNYTIAQCVESFYINRVKNWVFISEYNKALNKHLINNNQIKWRQIYNPVNPIYFTEYHNKINKAFYYVGAISERKGLIDILKCKISNTDIDSEINLYVVGGFINNQYKESINKQLNQSSTAMKPHFLGWKGVDEIIEIAGNASYFILPAHQETLPVVIAEAMAMGKIVISTNICGIPEMVVDGETGFLYTPGDLNTLTKLIHKVVNMPDNEIVDMSKKAQNRAKAIYHPKNVVEQTISFYNDVCRL